MNFDLSQIKGYLDLLYTIGTILGAMGVLWWRIARASFRNKEAFKSLQRAVGEMIATNKIRDKEITREVHDLSRHLAALTAKLEEREKDINKLEGALDVSRKDIVLLVSSLQQSTSSLDAMWRTLQKLFPDQVPQRMSDKSFA